MTYKHSILKNHLQECMESFRQYNIEHNIFWASMNKAIQDQYLNVNYKYRFIEHMV